MPIPVSETAKASTSASAVEIFVVGAPARLHRFDGQGHLAVMRELESVGEQVLDDLLQPFGIGEHRLGQARVEADEEVDVLGFGNVPEGPLDITLQIVQPQTRWHRP